MAEVYVREVRDKPRASVRDVEVLNRSVYERYKSSIRRITEEAVSKAMENNPSGYVVDRLHFYVKNGKLTVDGDGIVALYAKKICERKYGKPRSSSGEKPIGELLDEDDAATTGVGIALATLAILLACS